LAEATSVADLFWASLENDKSSLADHDKQFLQHVFNPMLSDRRTEGDCFVPPDVSNHYLTKLKGLVKEEENLRQQRKDYFVSRVFSVDDPGDLFPSSWKSAFEVVNGQDKTTKSAQSILHPRPDFVALDIWKRVLDVSRADFDKTTEDGMRLRIYKLVNLEIRTVQELGEEEVVAAVFSARHIAKDQKRTDNSISGYDMIAKATEYVEAGGHDNIGDDADMKKKLGDRGLYRHYYVILETDAGHRIVTEQLASGQTTWQEDPHDVDGRNSCAKVIRTAICRDSVCVRDVKSYQESEVLAAAPQSACKWYARGVFSKACGQAAISNNQYRHANTVKRANGNSPLLAGAPCID
jgi:hypothetical protein